MSALTDAAEVRILNFIRNATPAPPTLPLKAALTTTVPTDAAAGTEVTAGSGGSYVRQTITFAAPVSPGGTMANDTALTWPNMPTCTVVGVEVWDSAGTPVRWLWLPLTETRSFTLGDVAQFDIGKLTFAAA